MSTKSASFLLWDLTSCPSANVEILQSVISATGYKFSTFLLFADSSKDLPPSVSDLNISFNCIVRFGEYALYDTITDLMSCIKSTKKFNIAVISTRLSIWLSLLQRCQPANFLMFSSVDPRDIFDFSFLPPTIPTKIYQWPSLAIIDDDVSGASDQKDSSEDEEEEEENERRRPQQQYKTPNRYQQRNSDDEVESEQDSSRSPMMSSSPIQSQTQNLPTQNLLESNKRLNFKSATTKDPLDSPQTGVSKGKRKSSGNNQNVMLISMEFRPLIEAMKSVGKSMVALNDFETHLRSWSQAEGVKVPDVMGLILKGVDAGLVIFDQTINYLRFRNRSIPTSQIKYE